MCEIAATRVRYGYRKIRMLLLREGYQVSKNREPTSDPVLIAKGERRFPA